MTSTMAKSDACSAASAPGPMVDVLSVMPASDSRLDPVRASIEPTSLGVSVESATNLLSVVVATLDPSRLTGSDAARLYRLFAGVERLSTAGKMLLAPRIDESGIWRDDGHRSPAVMLAALEGVPTGQARNTLEVGKRLPELPGTEEALRGGALSGPKLTELSSAALLDPESESLLLTGAADLPLQVIKERCQRARATAQRQDPDAAVRRIRAARHFSSWSDAEGAFCFEGRDTADRGAMILEQMQYTVGRLRKERMASSSGRDSLSGPADERKDSEPDRALRADALFLLMTGRTNGIGSSAGTAVVTTAADPSDPWIGDEDPGPPAAQIALELAPSPGSLTPVLGGVSGARCSESGASGPGGARPVGSRRTESGPAGVKPDLARTTSNLSTRPSGGDDLIDRPPTCSIMVRVDLDALLRGYVEPGEVCQIDNQGPIPVAMARDLANDSFLRLVFHRAGDIRAISHFGRTINKHLRTALAHRDRCCVVPGCGVSYGLEIDHVIPFAEGGPTELANLALLCHHHHYLKTYEGWTLVRKEAEGDAPLSWEFVPMPPFGEEPGLGAD